MHAFTIAPSAPFLTTLARALLEGRLIAGYAPGRDPQLLGAATLYLPTRRACRMAREAFLDALGGRAAILPRIVALGDIDEDELAFASTAGADAAFDTPPAVGTQERRLRLATLIAAWSAQLARGLSGTAPLIVPDSSSALGLADDLARLIDDMTTRQVPWSALDGLAPDAVDSYWQITLEFLKIAREAWPAFLTEQGLIDMAARRDLLLAAEARRLANTPDAPVIAAGSTGSMPATAAFLAAVAAMPHGAVVLPGLDTELDDASWQIIAGSEDKASEDAHPAASHPQFALHALLKRLGIHRRDVISLTGENDQLKPDRTRLVSEAMRPAAATALWHDSLTAKRGEASWARSLDGMAVIAAANPEDEALAIAVALRETLETQDKTAALITPDRALARRVVAALARWSIEPDDSGGDPLSTTPHGLFAQLVAEVALKGCEPAALLALLKHPLCRCSGTTDGLVALEIAVLRGPRPAAKLAGLAESFAAFRAEYRKLKAGEPSTLHPSEMRARLDGGALEAATLLIDRLSAAISPLEAMSGQRDCPLATLALIHRDAIAQLSTAPDQSPAAFEDPAGAALAETIDSIVDDAARSGFALPAHDYPDAIRTLLRDRTVRRAGAPGARLRILGPLEARLMDCDRVILGGLVEGIWPPQPPADPWLNRPMRHALGLDLPDRRIGLSAHDFAQLLGTREVILTYAAKSGGSPAVMSRFLHRLKAVMGEASWDLITVRGHAYLDLARRLDWRDGQIRKPVSQPKPRPPRAARPMRLAVTDIEHWLRDPYTIYARHILKLERLDPIDMPPGRADLGSAIHGALGDFAKAFPRDMPPDAARRIVECGAAHFAPLMARPEARALWWPRFLRIASWIAQWDATRRDAIAEVVAETRGTMQIPLGDRTFVLSARADRIERRHDGHYAILDYKTGTVPSDKQVRIGVSPQLTLEAAILRAGGFEGIPAGASVVELAYVKLGGGEPAGEFMPRRLKKDRGDSGLPPDAAAGEALMELTRLVAEFEDETMPYASLVRPIWTSRYGTYDDLARVKEWSATGDDGAGGDT